MPDFSSTTWYLIGFSMTKWENLLHVYYTKGHIQLITYKQGFTFGTWKLFLHFKSPDFTHGIITGPWNICQADLWSKCQRKHALKRMTDVRTIYIIVLREWAFVVVAVKVYVCMIASMIHERDLQLELQLQHVLLTEQKSVAVETHFVNGVYVNG